MTEPRDRYPEELEAAAHQVALRLAELGTAEADAQWIAWELAEHLRRAWGGRVSYIRLPEKADAAQLDLLGGEAASVQDCELLADVAEQVEERLVATGAAHDEAARLGREVAAHLNAFWGGGQLYICKGRHYEIGLLHSEIYRRFNGYNQDYLAREYDMTVTHVYRIVKRVGAEERAKRQGALFPAETTHNSNPG